MTADKSTFLQSVLTSGVAVGILGWLGKRQVARLDKLEDRIMSREDFLEYKEEWDRRHTRMEDKLDRLIERNIRMDKP